MIGHWIEKYTGMKWTSDYNCFDHFCHVQKKQFNLDVLADVNINELPEFEDRAEGLAYVKKLKKWHTVNIPKEGDAVLFGCEGSTFHIGTYIHSNNVKGILNNHLKYGVVLTPLMSFTINGSADRVYMRYYA